MSIIDVIQFNGLSRDWLVYRYPGNTFVAGTQLIVGEGQIAVFVKGGKALDYFSAGTYTLSTLNIPVLTHLVNLPFGRKTPFSAEVFFINRTAKLDLLWGTMSPISLIDPKYAVRLRVRAFGQFGIRITDFRVFLTELIGAVGDNNIVKYDTVVNYFRGLTVTKVKTIISDLIINEKRSVLEITPQLESLSKTVQQALDDDFERFGIEMINFFISSINFPDEDFEIINKILGEKAAFEIIGDNRYNVKRTFDVMETAAGNEANGGIAAAGMGLGVGTGAGLAVGNMFSNKIVNDIPMQTPSAHCGKCGTANEPNANFCRNCGEKLNAPQIECYSCQKLLSPDAKFCSHCGSSMAKKGCMECGAEHMPGVKFCSECGTRMEG